jgi:hypothetical protein
MAACRGNEKRLSAFLYRPADDCYVVITEDTMRSYLLFVCATLMLASTGTTAFAQQTNGKNCRMEQQCHWENFKKVCVMVKVCR